MKDNTYRFSIFTATYNRASMLSSLYECLKIQDYPTTDFEWVIVSDGSTDNTAELVETFQKDGILNIVFVNKPNGGKHTAWQVATKIFKGKYVITCDDDDPVSSNMLTIFDKYWKQLELSENYGNFWEVKSRVKTEDGRLVGPEFTCPFFDSDYNELTFKRSNGCEMHACRKVEVLRNEARVPDSFYFSDKCSNFPEGVRWSRAARKYQTRYVQDITRVYVVGHESLCTNTNPLKRSSKRNYNSLVSALYSLNEQRDLLIRYLIAAESMYHLYHFEMYQP